MTTTERARHAKRRQRAVIATTLAAASLTACAPGRAAPNVAPVSSDPQALSARGGVTERPVRHVKPHPKPAKIGTALSIRHLRVTMYCYTGSRTASGTWPHTGDVATLDRSIPFGTRLRVAGLGVFTVTDRIGHGSDVDVYSGDRPGCEHRAAVFGVQHRVVEIERAA